MFKSRIIFATDFRTRRRYVFLCPQNSEDEDVVACSTLRLDLLCCSSEKGHFGYEYDYFLIMESLSYYRAIDRGGLQGIFIRFDRHPKTIANKKKNK